MRLKLNPHVEVADELVGWTIRSSGDDGPRRVVNLREAGAKEVHMRISCPPHNTPATTASISPTGKLIANQHSMDQIRDYLARTASATSTCRG